MKWIPCFLATSRFLCFVLFSGPIEAELPLHCGCAMRLLILGSVGDLSPSHHILANLSLPREPRSAGRPRKTSACLTQVGSKVSLRRVTPLEYFPRTDKAGTLCKKSNTYILFTVAHIVHMLNIRTNNCTILGKKKVIFNLMAATQGSRYFIHSTFI